MLTLFWNQVANNSGVCLNSMTKIKLLGTDKVCLASNASYSVL